jgi:hypothetical protein
MSSRTARFYSDWQVNNPFKNSLPIIHILCIVILGGISGMIANSFFNRENQDYNENAIHIEKQLTVNSTHPKNKPVKQEIVESPVVSPTTITSIYNENKIAADQQTFTLFEINTDVISYPYISLPDMANEYMEPPRLKEFKALPSVNYKK